MSKRFGDIVQYFINYKENMRMYHWQTKKHSRHVASGEHYASVDTLIDQFVETLQGKYGRVYLDTSNNKVVLGNNSDEQIVEFMKKFAEYLVEEIPKILDNKKDTDLLNIRDEILADINKTLYLFTLN
jgi:vacuolar-type H+-ATPase subunit E/Vma4